MNTIENILLRAVNDTPGRGLREVKFLDEINSKNTVTLNFDKLVIESSAPVELTQAPDESDFFLKIPANYSRMAATLFDDDGSGTKYQYTIGNEGLQEIESAPFSVNLIGMQGLVVLKVLDHKMVPNVLARFSFFRVSADSVDDKNSMELSMDSEKKTLSDSLSAFPSPNAGAPSSALFSVTLEDGPFFRSAVAEYEFKIPRLFNDLNKSNETLLNFATLSRQTDNNEVQLTHLLRHIIKYSTPEATRKVEEDNHVVDLSVIEKLSSMRRDSDYKDLVVETRPKLSTRLVSMEGFAAKRRAFDDESKKYYDWLSKLLSSGKGSSDKFLVKRKTFELAKIDYMMYLLDTMFAVKLKFVANNEDGAAFINTARQSQRERKKFRTVVARAASLQELKKLIESTLPEEAGETYVAPSLVGDKSGILFSRGGQGKSGWHKQWVVLSGGKLTEYMDWKQGTSIRNPPIDLSLCNVKLIDMDKRKNCFRLTTSSGVERCYQALDNDDLGRWMQALFDAGQEIKYQSSSASSKELRHSVRSSRSRHTLSPPVEPQMPRRVSSVTNVHLKTVQRVSPSNLKCCDCGSMESVEWISMNLLVVFCIQCSSCHRSLGTNISKVKSLKLDTFDRECEQLLSAINNNAANACFESLLLPEEKIDATASDEDRLKFITMKYAERAWVDASACEEPSTLLIHGIKAHKMAEICTSLACGADIDLNVTRGPKEGETEPVDFSILEYALSHPYRREDHTHVFDTAELLILNGCDLGDKAEAHIKLSEDALKFWQHKIDKVHGVPNMPSSPPVQRTLASNGAPHHTNRGHLPLVNTALHQVNTRSRGTLRSPRDKISNLLRIKNKT